MDYSYYAFLDVMGYKEHIDRDMKSGTYDFKEKLISSFRVFENIQQGNIKYKSISDSIFVSSPNSIVEFLKTIKLVSISFLKCGLLLRGGIAYERHFENSTITYSLALSEAYKLESKQSIFPRILIHPSVIEKAINEKNLGTNLHINDIIKENLILKCGNYYQLHIIDDDNWIEIYDSTKKIYENDFDAINKNPKILSYYAWLHNYLFHFKPKNVRKNKFIHEFQPLDL